MSDGGAAVLFYIADAFARSREEERSLVLCISHLVVVLA